MAECRECRLRLPPKANSNLLSYRITAARSEFIVQKPPPGNLLFFYGCRNCINTEPRSDRLPVICSTAYSSLLFTKMIFQLIFASFLCAILAAPQDFNPNLDQFRGPSTEPIPILRQESEVNPDGSYRYLYETGNGIVGEQQGYLKDIGAEEPALQVQGSNSYPAPDGQIISIQYTANENGYQPIGDHLPVAPPSPPAILRALEYIAAHSTPEPPSAGGRF